MELSRGTERTADLEEVVDLTEGASRARRDPEVVPYPDPVVIDEGEGGAPGRPGRRRFATAIGVLLVLIGAAAVLWWSSGDEPGPSTAGPVTTPAAEPATSEPATRPVEGGLSEGWRTTLEDGALVVELVDVGPEPEVVVGPDGVATSSTAGLRISNRSTPWALVGDGRVLEVELPCEFRGRASAASFTVTGAGEPAFEGIANLPPGLSCEGPAAIVSIPLPGTSPR